MSPVDTAPPSIDHLAKSIAVALARTLRAYLPVETRSVEARLDALELQLSELERKVRLLGESLSHSLEEDAGWQRHLDRDGNRGEL